MTPTPMSPRNGKSERRTRRGFAALVAGAVAGTVLLGGGAAWAYWTASAKGTGTVTTPAVSITQTNFGNLGATYINTHTSLTNTGNFTVTNTGAVAGTATVSIAGPDSLLAKLPILVWPVANTAACTAATTPPASAVSGTWGSTSVTSTLALAANASQMYCVRTAVAVADRPGLAVASGTQSGTPSITATLAASGWTATATTATPLSNTQKTEAIFPLDTAYLADPTKSRWFTVTNGGQCLDVFGGGAASNGNNASSYGCGTAGQSNQIWQFTQDGGDSSKITARPGSGATLRLASGTGGNQQVSTAGNGSEQRWFIQKAGANSYLMVSASDGKCLVMTAANASPQATADCNTPNTRVNLTRVPLTFSKPFLSSGQFSFGYPIGSTGYTAQFYNGVSWVTMGTAASGTTTMSLGISGMSTGNTYPGRILATGTSEVMYDFAFSYGFLSGITMTGGIG